MSQARRQFQQIVEVKPIALLFDDVMDSSALEARALDQTTDTLAILSEVACNLESITRELADSLGEGIPPEAAAVMNMLVAGDMRRAGFQVSPNIAMETFKDHAPLATQISMENMRSLLSRVVNAIREFLRTLFRRIGDFFVRVFGDTGRARIRLHRLRNVAEDANGTSMKHSKVNIGTFAYNIATERGVPSDGKYLVVSLKELLHEIKGLREDYLPVVVKIGHEFSRHLIERPTSADGLDGWLSNLNDVAAQYDVQRFTKVCARVGDFTDSRYPNGTTSIGPQLPGCRALAFMDGRKIYADKLDGTTSERADAMQGSRVELVRVNVERVLDTQNAVMNTMPVTTIDEVLDLVGELLDEIDASANSSFHSDLQRHGRELDAAAAQVAVGNEEQLYLTNRGLQYCQVYGQWMHKPYLQMLNHTLAVCRGTMGTCARHLKAYDRG